MASQTTRVSSLSCVPDLLSENQLIHALLPSLGGKHLREKMGLVAEKQEPGPHPSCPGSETWQRILEPSSLSSLGPDDSPQGMQWTSLIY